MSAQPSLSPAPPLAAVPAPLADRFRDEGETLAPGTTRLLLHDPGRVHLVVRGTAELFAVKTSGVGLEADRSFLLSREEGELLWGVGVHEGGDGFSEGILAVLTPGTELRSMRASRLVALARETEGESPIADLTSAWITALSRGVTGELRPRQQDLSATVSWRRDPALSILDDFHRTLLASLAEGRRAAREADRDRRHLRIRADRDLEVRTRAELRGVLEPERRATAATSGSPLARAVTTVLGALSPDVPPFAAALDAERDPVRAYARAAGARVRTVALRGAWWRADQGPLLAFRRDDRRPVALLFTGGGYDVVDGETGRREPVRSSEGLEPFAHTFYRRLPARRLALADLVAFGLVGVKRDLVTVLAAGAAAGALAVVPPLATGLIFDTIIPGAARAQLVEVAVGLVLAAFVGTLFGVTRSIATVRAESRIGTSLQAAVWDRLLDLPTGFFRGFTAGDLALRAFGVDTIQRSLSSGAVATLMSGLFGLFNAALLFKYDARLAFAGAGLVLVAVLVTLVSGARQLRLQKALAEVQGRIQGLVLQLIGGMAKLRIAGAEGRAFARWAEAFAEQRRLALRARAPLQVFGAVYPVVAAMVLYGLVGSRASGKDALSAGSLIAFVAAFQLFLTSTLQACQSLLGIAAVAPAYERLEPILEATPEATAERADPGPLRGGIEVAHVTFQYGPDGPPVLSDVSLSIRPGEFVAVVGASGSGKSTLLRLLLGFERPTAGTVSFDGRDLAGLDLRAVRRQIGVVLQDGKLFTGSILTNILGASNLGVDQALKAARLAGLDRDLDRMPMGVHTVVSEGGSTLSGGQRQRILIARALVKEPKLLLFDEATSALDNETQAAVSAGIERLETTRVVIAHRLSTIARADRIFVMARGRLVQQGTYEELVAVPGPFQDLAKRQVA